MAAADGFTGRIQSRAVHPDQQVTVRVLSMSDLAYPERVKQPETVNYS